VKLAAGAVPITDKGIAMTSHYFGFARQLGWVALGLVLTNTSFAQQFSQNRSHTNTKRGALLGGVAGAAVGGIVGNQKDRAGKGALIGGAVGAIAGAAIGNERDKQNARQAQMYQYYTHPTYAHHPAHSNQPVYVTPQTFPNTPSVNGVRRPVSVSEVINMSRSGVGESVIISHIRTNGVQTRPTTNDIVLMAQQGVTNPVIAAMQGDFSQQPVYAEQFGGPYVPPSPGVVPSGSQFVPSRSLLEPPPLERRGF